MVQLCLTSNQTYHCNFFLSQKGPSALTTLITPTTSSQMGSFQTMLAHNQQLPKKKLFTFMSFTLPNKMLDNRCTIPNFTKLSFPFTFFSTKPSLTCLFVNFPLIPGKVTSFKPLFLSGKGMYRHRHHIWVWWSNTTPQWSISQATL